MAEPEPTDDLLTPGPSQDIRKPTPEFLSQAVYAPEVLSRFQSDTKLRERIVNTLLPLFVGVVVATFTLLFLLGFGWIELPTTLQPFLGASMVGEVGGLLIVVVRNLFPGGEATGT